jgi:predicted NBD/HSP70 family sugar kinase
VVGGALAASWDLIRGPLQAGIAQVHPELRDTLDLATAQRPDDAALIGAAWHAQRVAMTRPGRSP